jgi:hypothetical protein
MGTTAYGGKGFKERTRVSGEVDRRRQLQTALHAGVMPPPHPETAGALCPGSNPPQVDQGWQVDQLSLSNRR